MSAAPIKVFGAILYASDDPARVRDVARTLKAQGRHCEITCGIDTYYAIREVRYAFERGYLKYRAALSAWTRERFGVKP